MRIVDLEGFYELALILKKHKTLIKILECKLQDLGFKMANDVRVWSTKFVYDLSFALLQSWKFKEIILTIIFIYPLTLCFIKLIIFYFYNTHIVCHSNFTISFSFVYLFSSRFVYLNISH